MRNDIRNLLNRMEERHAGTKFTVAKSIERLTPALATLTDKGAFHECKECGDPGIRRVLRGMSTTQTDTVVAV